MSDEIQSQPNVWDEDNASERYFAAMGENRARMREILGISNDGIEIDEPLSESLLSEDLRNRFLALVAFGTEMFEKGLGQGATYKDAMSEPTDDELFPNPWNHEARTEIQLSTGDK